MTQRLSKLLMLGALAVLWLPALSFGWNAVSRHKLKSQSLIGVQVAAIPASLTIEHLVDGSFQRSFAQYIGSAIPFHASAVRLHNQVFYATLRLSTLQYIVVGKNDQLLNPAYITAYCYRSIAKSAQNFDSWAQMLREIQDKIESRGQIFIYVLTPSKIEQLPEALPLGLPCPSKDRQQFLPAAVAHLQDRGVKYIDATATVNQEPRKYGYEPFPVGGIHWTDLASYPATMKIIQIINASKEKTVIEPYSITVRPGNPTATERDFLSLLNLSWLPRKIKTAQISVDASVHAPCLPPVSIVAIGGSFFTSLGTGLSVSPCPPKISQLTYFVIATMHFAGGVFTLDQTPDYSLLASSDVVLVEENAGILLNTKHIGALHKYLYTGELPQRVLY
jgi:alginate O-acetyltransferase complex protein AlgJ